LRLLSIEPFKQGDDAFDFLRRVGEVIASKHRGAEYTMTGSSPALMYIL
jgi:hypothetical protein